MKTPKHIQPEWYFLFAYTVLRRIPSKRGGILAIVFSMGVLVLVPYSHRGKFQGLRFYPICRVMFWCFVCNFLFITWLGIMDVEEVYIFAGQVGTYVHFGYFIMLPIVMALEDVIIFSWGLISLMW